MAKAKEEHKRLLKIEEEIEGILQKEKVTVTDAEWVLWQILNKYKKKVEELRHIVTVDELPKDEN